MIPKQLLTSITISYINFSIHAFFKAGKSCIANLLSPKTSTISRGEDEENNSC